MENQKNLESLVSDAINAYGKLPNDSMVLDLLGVKGAKRALVLESERYQMETKKIYAQKMLDELNEIDSIAKMAMGGGGDDFFDDDRKSSAKADKEAMAARFKASEIRRSILNKMTSEEGSAERDAVNICFVPITKEEFEKSGQVEVYRGKNGGADDLGELAGTKEIMPTGSAKRDFDDEAQREELGEIYEIKKGEDFDVLSDGSIVEM